MSGDIHYHCFVTWVAMKKNKIKYFEITVNVKLRKKANLVYQQPKNVKTNDRISITIPTKQLNKTKQFCVMQKR